MEGWEQEVEIERCGGGGKWQELQGKRMSNQTVIRQTRTGKKGGSAGSIMCFVIYHQAGITGGCEHRVMGP